MKLCLLIKYPPIQGGVSAQGFWAARALAQRGHDVHVVTHAGEVEATYRLHLDDEDRAMLESTFDRGRVVLHAPEPPSRKIAHIPQSNPIVSKLAGRATDVIRHHGCELIFSYYFEPFSVAGHLASSFTGVPHVTRHAGSDLGRLMLHPDLAPTYAEVLRRVDGIVSGNPHPFVAQGLPASAVYQVPPYYLPTDFFHRRAAPLELDATIDRLRRLGATVASPGPFDASRPTLGIYGKLGEQKGSFDLIEALARLAARGLDFNFVALTQGTRLPEFLERVRGAGLEGRTWVLPFIAHWKVARFIRACTAVCFLERDFQISFHTPSVPREVLACGTCLVLSGEVLQKQIWRDQMVDGENFVSVPDPKDIDQLAAALEQIVRDPDRARRIGERGGAVTFLKASADELAAAYESVFTDVLRRRREGRSADVRAAEQRVLDLVALLPQLVQQLGEPRFRQLAAAFASDAPTRTSGNADAEQFLDRVEVEALEPAERDAVAFSRHLLWMGREVEGERVARPFGEAPDAAPLGGGSSSITERVPVRSALARLARFEHLSARVVSRGKAGAAVGPTTVLFNKQANFLGHYFVVGDGAARLLELCDGKSTVREIVARLAQQAPRRRAADALEAEVIAMLRLLYQNRAISFVDRA